MENKETNYTSDIVPLKETFFRDYFPYWPYFILSAMLAFFAAYVHLRYQVPQYSVTSTIVIKAEKEGINTMVEKMIGGNAGNANNNIQDKLYVLQSNKIKMLAVKTANLQVSVESRGKLGSIEKFLSLPFEIVFLQPDSVLDFKGIFFYDAQKRGLNINGKLFPFNRMLNLGGNALIIKCADPSKYSDTNTKYTLSLFSPMTAAAVNGGNFTAQVADKGSSIINLSLNTNIPEKGVRMLNAIMQSYKNVTMEEKLMQAKNTIQFVDERLRVLSSDLDSVEGSLESFKRSNGITDISVESELFMENVAESDKMLAQLDLQLTLLGDLERYVIGRGKNPGLVPSLIGLPDGGYTSGLLNKLYEAELKLQEIKARNGDKSDMVITAKQEIQTMKESLFESIQNVRKNLQTLRREYNSKAGKYNELMRDIPSKERKLLNITRQQMVKNGLYTFLLEKREEAAIQYSATLGGVQVLQAATANYSPVSPNSERTYTIAVVFALSIVALSLFLKRVFNNKLQFRSEIMSETAIPVLDEIVQVDSESPLVMKNGNRSLIAEQFRSLRTNLGYFKTQTPGKCKVLVSSSIPGEGKSFVSSNLAISYSLVGLRTVLVESDLRKPNVAKHFKINKRLGLSNYLSGNTSSEDILFESGMTNLWVIPAGPIPPNPAELISGSSRYSDLLNDLMENYDRVVIDCPPIGLVTDAQLLCDFVDITLFICRQGHTPQAALSNLLNPLYESGKFGQMGLVFNGLNQNAKTFYGYGYGYGYGNYGYGNYGYGNYGYGYYDSKHKAPNFMMKLIIMLLAPILAPISDLRKFLGKKSKN